MKRIAGLSIESLAALLLLMAGWVEWRWGHELRLGHPFAGMEDRDGDQRPDRWIYGDFVLEDQDSDGKIDGQSSSERELWVTLGGVPFRMMQELWASGRFRIFHRPVPLMGTFPSLTDPATAALFGEKRAPGYERRYFDRDENRLRGGLLASLGQSSVPHLERLDYRQGILEVLAYVVPAHAFRADLWSFQESFETSNASVYYAQLASVSRTLELRPRDTVSRLMEELEDVLTNMWLEADGRVRMVLLSPHGHSLVPSRRVNLERFLGIAGYSLGRSLGRAKSVVVPRHGPVGVIPLYAPEEDIADLMKLLPQLEGVDFCVSRNGEWSGSPALPHLESKVRDGFVRHVVHGADVLVGLKDGYYFGSPWLDLFVRIYSTGGGLSSGSMQGFVMTTDTMLETTVDVEGLADELAARETGS